MRKKSRRSSIALGFLLSSVMMSFIHASQSIDFASGDSINPHIYSTDSAPYGITYQEWTQRFWQWLLSLPASQHPRENYTPEKCASGQEGPVWFLEAPLSGKQDRTCTVPAGKSILAAILQGWCDTSDAPTQNDVDIRKCATEGNDYGAISGSLDGVEFKDLDNYRIDSGFYNLTVVEDNLYGEKAGGPYRAFTNGYFVFLEPLSPGEHDIHLTASVVNPINPQYNYAAEWTYHLIIDDTATTSNQPVLLEGSSSSGKFRVLVNWTSNDLGKDNDFAIKILDAKGNELSGATYDVMLYKGATHLAETHRPSQTAMEQKYSFAEAGSYVLRIDNINNSGEGDQLNIPIQVTPEFPLIIAIFMLAAGLFATAIFATGAKVKNLFSSK